MSETEITTINGYAVYMQNGDPITTTDTFVSAIEAAEMHALQLSKEIDPETAEVSVVSDEASKTAEGFFCKWIVFDDAEEEGELHVFRRYRKPDGYLLTGAWREKAVANIKVKSVPIEFFEGLYVAFEEDSETDSSPDSGELSSSDDEGSDDQTYVE